MNESLIQQYYVNDRYSLSIKEGFYLGCKISSFYLKMINKKKKSWLILVPAAAVIREGLALFKITGRKEFVDGFASYILNI